MSREIKFRAWDGKGMINPSCVKHSKAYIIKECSRDDEVITKDGVNYYCNWDIDWMTNHPLMQYTGLKDANGVEIYEGDILSDGHFIWSVEYCRGMFVANRGGYNTDPLFSILIQRRQAKMPCFVVGNIYENHELLPNE